MGAEQSAPGAAFTALYESLPDDVCRQIDALCGKGEDRLLKPHLGAPPAFPTVPIGTSVRLSHEMATAALAVVPRLQRKHYEMIPKAMPELDFWISFFSHLTAIIEGNCPEKLGELAAKASWQGSIAGGLPDSFTAAWSKLNQQQRKAVAALVSRESDALLAPASASPPAFPTLPVGMVCFVDQTAATAALSALPELQKKHSVLVPRKLDERSFWVHFFSHMTVILGADGRAQRRHMPAAKHEPAAEDELAPTEAVADEPHGVSSPPPGAPAAKVPSEESEPWVLRLGNYLSGRKEQQQQDDGSDEGDGSSEGDSEDDLGDASTVAVVVGYEVRPDGVIVYDCIDVDGEEVSVDREDLLSSGMHTERLVIDFEARYPLPFGPNATARERRNGKPIGMPQAPRLSPYDSVPSRKEQRYA